MSGARVGDNGAGDGSTGDGSTGADSTGDESSPRRLERRARRLLRAYPPGYREHRGEEILGTLLEAARPGRGWPSARDTTSVIASGVRARREANHRQGMAASLRQAALLGVTLYLLGLMLGSYLQFAVWEPGPVPASATVLLPFTALAPLAAAWCGRRRLVAVTAVIAGAACAYAPVHALVRGNGRPASGFHVSLNPVVLEKGLAVPLLALAALVLVTRSGERPPRSWLWLPVLGVVLPTALDIWWSAPIVQTLDRLDAWVTPWPYLSSSLPVIMAGASACWLMTDFRPLTGVAIGFALTRAFNELAYPFSWLELIETGVTLVVAVDLTRRLRRQARASAPGR